MATPRRRRRRAAVYVGEVSQQSDGTYSPDSKAELERLLFVRGVRYMLDMRENSQAHIPPERTLQRWLAEAKKEKAEAAMDSESSMDAPGQFTPSGGKRKGRPAVITDELVNDLVRQLAELAEQKKSPFEGDFPRWVRRAVKHTASEPPIRRFTVSVRSSRSW